MEWHGSPDPWPIRFLHLRFRSGVLPSRRQSPWERRAPGRPWVFRSDVRQNVGFLLAQRPSSVRFAERDTDIPVCGGTQTPQAGMSASPPSRGLRCRSVVRPAEQSRCRVIGQRILACSHSPVAGRRSRSVRRQLPAHYPGRWPGRTRRSCERRVPDICGRAGARRSRGRNDGVVLLQGSWTGWCIFCG